jgi:hypothetical protein
MSHNLNLAQDHAWHLARTLMVPVVLFQSEGAFGVMEASEYEGGEDAVVIGRSVSVDSIAMGEALARDRRGRELPVWQGCRTLGASEIFLMNWDVQDSLDGRYFGPIPKDSIIGHALPLWTDEGGDGRYQWRAPTH